MSIQENTKGAFSLQAIVALALMCVTQALCASQTAASEFLEIVVNTASGEITLSNPSSSPISFDFYDISSLSGSLLEGDGDWLSFSDQELDGAGNWSEAPSSQFGLLELAILDGSTFDPSESVSIGMAYNVSVDGQDLEFSYLPLGEVVAIPGLVQYVSTSIPEPSTLMLIASAGVGLAMRKRSFLTS